jgi:hypothetical protein
MNSSNSSNYYGGIGMVSSDGSAWTSLGRITWANAVNGDVFVRRIV